MRYAFVAAAAPVWKSSAVAYGEVIAGVTGQHSRRRRHCISLGLQWCPELNKPVNQLQTPLAGRSRRISERNKDTIGSGRRRRQRVSDDWCLPKKKSNWYKKKTKKLIYRYKIGMTSMKIVSTRYKPRWDGCVESECQLVPACEDRARKHRLLGEGRATTMVYYVNSLSATSSKRYLLSLQGGLLLARQLKARCSLWLTGPQ